MKTQTKSQMQLKCRWIPENSHKLRALDWPMQNVHWTTIAISRCIWSKKRKKKRNKNNKLKLQLNIYFVKWKSSSKKNRSVTMCPLNTLRILQNEITKKETIFIEFFVSVNLVMMLKFNLILPFRLTIQLRTIKYQYRLLLIFIWFNKIDIIMLPLVKSNAKRKNVTILKWKTKRTNKHKYRMTFYQSKIAFLWHILLW